MNIKHRPITLPVIVGRPWSLRENPLRFGGKRRTWSIIDCAGQSVAVIGLSNRPDLEHQVHAEHIMKALNFYWNWQGILAELKERAE